MCIISITLYLLSMVAHSRNQENIRLQFNMAQMDDHSLTYWKMILVRVSS